ncbi:MAG: hypothetical protein R3282_05430 [Rhodothermales bacterium]|nr:hypothetical protein [Rhodothermales bacterium]
MSKRLQVLFDEDELAELQEIARKNHMTLAEWVRQTLREARSQQPIRAAASKRQAVRRAMEHEFPTADIDEMIEQIERGYRPSSE